MNPTVAAPPPAPPGRPTARLEGLSDGVMAIAMTLLVLEIHIPEVPEGAGVAGLLGAAGSAWPSFVAFAISFFYIAIYWAHHHHAFGYIARADHVLTLLNAAFLLTIALVPFATALLAREFGRPGAWQGAAMVYGLLGVLSSLAFTALWGYATAGRRLLDDRLSDRAARRLLRESAGGVVWFAAAIGVAALSAEAAMAMFVLPFVFFGFPRKTVQAAEG